MIEPLQTALVLGSLLLATIATVYVVLDRLAGPVLLTLLAVLELGLLVQAVVGVAQVVSGDSGVDALVLVGYLLGALLFLPVAAVWALGEPSRAGTAGLALVGLVLPVLVLRIQQVWAASGG